MKKITLLILILNFSFSLSYGQYGDLIFSTTIDFEISHDWIQLDTSIDENIWRIGMPSKFYFDSAYTAPYAIITDTIYSYPENNYSYFDIIIDDDLPGWWEWGEGIIGFWHKYDTDSLEDGGYIEVSYDGGTSWMNIINDNIAMEISNIDFYSNSDTILGNIPAFTGYSNGWVYSEFYWWWNALVKDFPEDSLIVRFIFQSDENNTNKEGWMIDHIHFNGYEIIGGIENNHLYKKNIKVFPVPAKDYFVIEFNNNSEFTLELFDNFGKKIMKKGKNKTNEIKIDCGNFGKGIYYYRLFSNNERYSGKILIE